MTTTQPASRTSFGPLPDCPYQGLMPFSEDDADFFFGREEETRLVISNLRAYSTTVLFGPSGVGKTSILQAGVLRTLAHEQTEALAAFGRRESVACYLARWQGPPLRTLAAAINETLDVAASNGSAESVSDELDVDAVIARCAELDVDLLLILDQFEEYFYYHPTDAQYDPLAEALARLVAPGTRIHLLISLREDALATLDQFEEALPELLHNSLRLEHLDPEACRAAIQGPLDVYNARSGPGEPRWEVERSLVERLLVELRAGRVHVRATSTEPDTEDQGGHIASVTRVEAPYLQLVLFRLWEEETTVGSHLLRERTLEALGGSREVVEDHLDSVLGRFKSDELDVIAKAFGHLVTPSGTKIAHRASDLAVWIGVQPQQMRRLLDDLASGKRFIMRRVPPPLDDPQSEPRFEVFHDVLAAAVLEWTAQHDAKGRERLLVTERDKAAREAKQARKRLVRARAVIAVMVALISISLLSGFLVWNSQRHAEMNRLLTLSREQAVTDPNAALSSAIKAWKKDENGDTAEALRGAISANHARLILRMGAPGTRVILSDFIDDGNRILTVSTDNHLRVWSAKDGKLITDRDFTTDLNGEPFSATVLTDGSGAVVGGSNGIAVRVPFDKSESIVRVEVGSGWVWVLSGGTAERSVFVAHSNDSPPQVFIGPDYLGHTVGGTATTIGLDPEGTRLATWQASGTHGVLSLLDVNTGVTRGTTTLRDDWVRAIDISPSGVIAVAGAGYYDQASETHTTASLYLWDGTSSSAPRNNRLLSTHAINALNFSDDGTLVLLAGDKRTELIDVETGDWLQLAPELTDWVYAGQLSPDGARVVAAGRDGTVSVFSTYAIGLGAYLNLIGHMAAVNDVAFSSGGNEILTAGDDGTARVWRLPGTTMLDTREWTLEAQMSSDGATVAAVTSDHYVAVGEPGNELSWWSLPWRYHDEQGSDVAWEPDGRRLVATATDQSTPYLIDAAEPVPLDAMDDATVRVAWSPIADHVAVGGFGGSVGLWDVNSGALRWQKSLAPNGWDPAFSVNGVAFTSEGDVVAASMNGTIRILDRQDGTTIREFQQSKGLIVNAATSSDGRYVGTVSDDWRLRVWDLSGESDKPIIDRAAHRGTVSGVAFGGEGETARVATSGADGTVHVYDLPKGKLLAVLDVHGDGVNSVAFDPTDSSRIVSASDDGTVSVTPCDLCNVSDSQLLEYAERSQARIIG